MPIYEYQCTKCGKHFEIFQKMNDKPLIMCNVCKGALKKLVSNCSFQLKGTGWYATDYKKPVDSVGKSKASGNGSKDPETSKSNKEASSTASAEIKTEAKTEAKTETKTETKSETNTGSASN